MRTNLLETYSRQLKVAEAYVANKHPMGVYQEFEEEK